MTHQQPETSYSAAMAEAETHQQPSSKEEARLKLNKAYLRLAYGKSDIEKTKQEVDDILESLLTSHSEAIRERVENLSVTDDNDPWNQGYIAAKDDILALLTIVSNCAILHTSYEKM